MADAQPPAQAPAPAEGADNLHKDPVTGEMISKSERKSLPHREVYAWWANSAQ